MPDKKKASVLRCPSCSALVLKDGEDFPFCSDRCRRLDLGKWASGAYRISSPILDPDVLEDLESAQGQQQRGHGDAGDRRSGRSVGRDYDPHSDSY